MQRPHRIHALAETADTGSFTNVNKEEKAF